ncbi:hypothetical protein ACFVVL_28435 [Kitasatospora sp. NPDC058115]|uniref:hypothetical protein n=1 Tax=Kitasatospora sp. NPDC058115 TaxID=3346347 RepID=UPI0036DACDF1
MHVRAVVTATVLAELAGAVLAGLLLSLLWLLPGDWTTGPAWTGLPVMAAVAPPLDHFGRRPPHRLRGVLAGLLTLAVTGIALLTVTDLWFGWDGSLGGALALGTALPVAAGVFAAVSGPPAGRRAAAAARSGGDGA